MFLQDLTRMFLRLLQKNVNFSTGVFATLYKRIRLGRRKKPPRSRFSPIPEKSAPEFNGNLSADLLNNAEESLRVSADISGRSTPEVNWYLNGEHIVPSSERQEVSKGNRNHSLMFIFANFDYIILYWRSELKLIS